MVCCAIDRMVAIIYQLSTTIEHSPYLAVYCYRLYLPAYYYKYKGRSHDNRIYAPKRADSTSAKDCQLSESSIKRKFFPNSRTATTTYIAPIYRRWHDSNTSSLTGQMKRFWNSLRRLDEASQSLAKLDTYV